MANIMDAQRTTWDQKDNTFWFLFREWWGLRVKLATIERTIEQFPEHVQVPIRTIIKES